MPHDEIDRERGARNEQPADLGEAQPPPLAERDEAAEQHETAEPHAIEARHRRADMGDLDEQARRADRDRADDHLQQRAARQLVGAVHQATASVAARTSLSAAPSRSHSCIAGSASNASTHGRSAGSIATP